MPDRDLPTSKIAFLEELRSMAQLGLNYTKDPFDQERFERLLHLSAVEYGELYDLPPDIVLERFRAEIGHITPKVGVDAAIFDDRGRLLLIKRADDRLWGLPCGWAECGESPEETLVREIMEEICVEAEVKTLIDCISRKPGLYGQPHTSYNLIYHCVIDRGEATTSAEALEVGYFEIDEIEGWHTDHLARATRARRYWDAGLCQGR